MSQACSEHRAGRSQGDGALVALLPEDFAGTRRPCRTLRMISFLRRPSRRNVESFLGEDRQGNDARLGKRNEATWTQLKWPWNIPGSFDRTETSISKVS